MTEHAEIAAHVVVFALILFGLYMGVRALVRRHRRVK